MKKAILATKVGMTQIFNEDGTLTPVTVLQAGPCVVTQIKTVENDGYEAVQVGFVDKKDKTVNKDKNGKKEIVHRHGVTKAEQGHFAKAGVTGKRFVKEFKFENAADYALAQEIKADILKLATRSTLLPFLKEKDSRVLLRDTTSTEDLWLTVLNSIVIRDLTVLHLIRVKYSKERRCQDTWEAKKITIQNLEVVRVDAENNLLLVKGSVPGSKKSLVTIREAVKAN